MGPTYRAPVYCENGVVATPHHLATLAGVQVLQGGGKPVDAAIAANAVVSAAWPHMCGIGGDLFMLVYWAQSEDVFGLKLGGDTIYLCVVDRHGSAVSLIQSLFDNFGSGVVVPGAGVVLQNRGAAFNLDTKHPNHVAPRKRPFHTLIPALALSKGKPALVFGTRGANGQPQTQAQVLANVVDFGLNPQEAVEAPRWVHDGPASHHPANALVLESRVPDVERVTEDLRGRGHDVVVSGELDLGMGTAQLIQIDQQRGILMAGSDPRGDGIALGW